MLVKHFYQLKTYKKFCIQLGKVFENGFFAKKSSEKNLTVVLGGADVLFKKRRISLVTYALLRWREYRRRDREKGVLAYKGAYRQQLYRYFRKVY